MRRMFLGAALAALTPVLLASPATAGPKDVTVVARTIQSDQLQERVSYRDLDLTQLSAQKSLQRRVRRATETVCAPFFSGGVGDNDYDKCRDFAWDGAEPQMALAIDRARDIALTGRSDIPPVAIAVVAGF